MDDRKIDFFNNLFFLTDLNPDDNILRLIRNYRPEPTRYDQHLGCSCDDFINSYNSPNKLKDICLSYLHLNMALKVKLANVNQIFVDYRYAPLVINKLNLPRSLTLELLRLNVQCPRHCMLNCLVPRLQFRMFFALNPKAPLYKYLQQIDTWRTENNKKCFTFPKLCELLQDYTQDHQITLSQTQYALYLKRNCIIVISRFYF